MTASILVLVSGTNDRNRKFWRQGQDDKFGLEIGNSAQCAAEAKVANKNLRALENKNAIISSNKVIVQLHWEQSRLWLL